MASKVNKRTLSTPNLILITILVCIVVIGVGAFFGKKLYSQLALKHRIELKQSLAASQLSKNLTAAATLVQDYQSQSASTKQELADALPTSIDVPGLIALFEHLAGTSGVQLKSFGVPKTGSSASPSTSTPSTPSTASITPVQSGIEVGGSYADVISLMNTLNLSARPMVMSGLQITGTNSSLDATFELTTYYQTAPSLQPQTETIK